MSEHIAVMIEHTGVMVEHVAGMDERIAVMNERNGVTIAHHSQLPDSGPRFHAENRVARPRKPESLMGGAGTRRREMLCLRKVDNLKIRKNPMPDLTPVPVVHD